MYQINERMLFDDRNAIGSSSYNLLINVHVWYSNNQFTIYPRMYKKKIYL